MLIRILYLKLVWLDLISLFHDIFYGIHSLFNSKAILLEEHSWYYLTHSCGDKGLHIFPEGMSLKGNIIVELSSNSSRTVATIGT